MGARCDGAKWDLTTGAVLDGPATSPLTTYEVREADGQIQVKVWNGDDHAGPQAGHQMYRTALAWCTDFGGQASWPRSVSPADR
jgi:Rieske Fe-S protein